MSYLEDHPSYEVVNNHGVLVIVVRPRSGLGLGCVDSPSKWPLTPWLINGGDPITTYKSWDDPPSTSKYLHFTLCKSINTTHCLMTLCKKKHVSKFFYWKLLLKNNAAWIYPPRMPVTTRITTFLAGNPKFNLYLPLAKILPLWFAHTHTR